MMADYIRREAAILTVRRYAKNAIDKEVKELDVVDDVVNIVKELESVPAADVAEVVHGRWIPTHDEFCQCSICKYPTYIAWNTTKYCPNCGAMMDGGAKND